MATDRQQATVPREDSAGSTTDAVLERRLVHGARTTPGGVAVVVPLLCTGLGVRHLGTGASRRTGSLTRSFFHIAKSLHVDASILTCWYSMRKADTVRLRRIPPRPHEFSSQVVSRRDGHKQPAIASSTPMRRPSLVDKGTYSTVVAQAPQGEVSSGRKSRSETV